MTTLGLSTSDPVDRLLLHRRQYLQTVLEVDRAIGQTAVTQTVVSTDSVRSGQSQRTDCCYTDGSIYRHCQKWTEPADRLLLHRRQYLQTLLEVDRASGQTAVTQTVVSTDSVRSGQSQRTDCCYTDGSIYRHCQKWTEPADRLLLHRRQYLQTLLEVDRASGQTAVTQTVVSTDSVRSGQSQRADCCYTDGSIYRHCQKWTEPADRLLLHRRQYLQTLLEVDRASGQTAVTQRVVSTDSVRSGQSQRADCCYTDGSIYRHCQKWTEPAGRLLLHRRQYLQTLLEVDRASGQTAVTQTVVSTDSVRSGQSQRTDCCYTDGSIYRHCWKWTEPADRLLLHRRQYLQTLLEVDRASGQTAVTQTVVSTDTVGSGQSQRTDCCYTDGSIYRHCWKWTEPADRLLLYRRQYLQTLLEVDRASGQTAVTQTVVSTDTVGSGQSQRTDCCYTDGSIYRQCQKWTEPADRLLLHRRQYLQTVLEVDRASGQTAVTQTVVSTDSVRSGQSQRTDCCYTDGSIYRHCQKWTEPADRLLLHRRQYLQTLLEVDRASGQTAVTQTVVSTDTVRSGQSQRADCCYTDGSIYRHCQKWTEPADRLLLHRRQYLQTLLEVDRASGQTAVTQTVVSTDTVRSGQSQRTDCCYTDGSIYRHCQKWTEPADRLLLHRRQYLQTLLEVDRASGQTAVTQTVVSTDSVRSGQSQRTDCCYTDGSIYRHCQKWTEPADRLLLHRRQYLQTLLEVDRASGQTAVTQTVVSTDSVRSGQSQRADCCYTDGSIYRQFQKWTEPADRLLLHRRQYLQTVLEVDRASGQTAVTQTVVSTDSVRSGQSQRTDCCYTDGSIYRHCQKWTEPAGRLLLHRRQYLRSLTNLCRLWLNDGRSCKNTISQTLKNFRHKNKTMYDVNAIKNILFLQKILHITNQPTGNNCRTTAVPR